MATLHALDAKRLRHLAFGLFKEWTRTIQRRYPGIDLTIKDETELVNTTREALTETLDSLANVPTAQRHQSPDWPVEYVMGYFEGWLISSWFYEYIECQLPAYKHLQVLQSVWQLIEEDDVLRMRLKADYEEAMSRSNLQHLDTNIPYETPEEEVFMEEYDDDLYKSAIPIPTPPQNDGDAIKATFHNLMLHQLEEFQDVTETDVELNVLPYLPHRIILELLQENGII